MCQSKQIAKQRKPIANRIVQKKHRNTTSPSPPLRSNRGANAPIPSTSKGSQGDPQPPPSSSSSKKNGKPKINRPSPHTDDPIAMYSRYGVLVYWMWRAGRLGRRVAPYSCFYHVFYPMEHAWSAGQPREAQSTVISVRPHSRLYTRNSPP